MNEVNLNEVNGWDDLRPEVRDFALAMERRLRGSDLCARWSGMSWRSVLTGFHERAHRLWHVLSYGASIDLVVDEAAHVAIYAMILPRAYIKQPYDPAQE